MDKEAETIFTSDFPTNTHVIPTGDKLAAQNHNKVATRNAFTSHFIRTKVDDEPF